MAWGATVTGCVFNCARLGEQLCTKNIFPEIYAEMKHLNYTNCERGVLFMGTQYKSLREFAKLAKMSPQRVKELIESGKITSEEGRIPVSQLRYILRERFLNQIANGKGGVLYVNLTKTDEELTGVVDEIEGQGVTVIRNIDALIADIGANTAEQAIGMTSERMVINRYKKLVLKEFVKRLKSAVQRNLVKYCEDENISLISLGSLYELMLYNNIYSYEIEDMEYAKNLCASPLADMEQSFDVIISNLNLYDGVAGTPLFERDDVTPEFVKAVESLQDDASAVTNGVLYDIFSKSFCSGENKHGKGKDSQKILENIASGLSNLARATMISNLTSKGYCSILNMLGNITDTEIYKVSADLAGGFYSEVKFLCSKEEAQSNLSDAMALMFNSLAVAHKFRISYSE